MLSLLPMEAILDTPPPFLGGSWPAGMLFLHSVVPLRMTINAHMWLYISPFEMLNAPFLKISSLIPMLIFGIWPLGAMASASQ